LNPILVVLAFCAGLSLQAFLFTQSLSRPKEGRRFLALAFPITTALVLLPNLLPILFGHSPIADIAYRSFLLAVLVFCLVTVGILFHDQAVPDIGQANLLVFTGIFWLVFLRHWSGGGADTALGLWAGTATLGTLFTAFLRPSLNFLSKLYFYAWFLFINVYLCAFQVLSGDFRLVDLDHGWVFLGQHHPPQAFLAGMALLFFAVYVFYFSLAFGSVLKLSFKGSRQAKTRGGKKWGDAAMMVTHLSDYPIGAREALVILGIQGGLYLVNTLHPFLPLAVLVNFSIVVLPYVLRLALRALSPRA